MGKIGLIIKREYLSRVKKKSFIIMTILGPILIAAVFGGIAWFSQQDKEPQKIMVVEEAGPVFTNWNNGDNYSFEHLGVMPMDTAKKFLKNSNYTSLMYFQKGVLDHGSPFFYYKVKPSMLVQKAIENQAEKLVEDEKVRYYKVDPNIYKKFQQNFSLNAIKLTDSGEEDTQQNAKALIGFVFGILVFMFIFMYGVQVMRGVIEEKTSRIVEVMITSVKPFQLMMGKIIGIAMVGLTQFLLWVVLSSTFMSVATTLVVGESMSRVEITQQQTAQLLSQQKDKIDDMQEKVDPMDLTNPDHIINRINWPLMIGIFIFYFLGGYLLYASLFAAIGSAVDNETDTQQFMMPVTMPLMVAYILAIMMMENPEGDAAFWGSIIPFSSPIIMPIRIAMGMEGQMWQLVLSMVILVLTFVGMTWFAGKIYRIGILMYGKKVNYKEIWKWIRFNG